MLLQLIFIAFAIFFIMRVLDWLVISWLSSKKHAKTLRKLFPIIEFSTWTVFIFYVIINLFNNELIYETAIIIILAVILLFFSWFFIKDIIAGVIIKSEYNIEYNKKVRIKDFEGYINKIGYLSIELKTDSGEFIKIPYSKIVSEVIVWPENKKNLFYKHNFIAKVENSNNLHYSDYIAGIRTELLNSAWIISKKEPVINYINNQDNFYFYKIEIFALNEIHARKLEKNYSNITIN